LAAATKKAELQAEAAQKFASGQATPWSTRKDQILKSYAVTSVKVSADFLQEENNVEEARKNGRIGAGERTKRRLKELEEEEEGGAELTQKEYIDRITKVSTKYETFSRIIKISSPTHPNPPHTHPNPTHTHTHPTAPHRHAKSVGKRRAGPNDKNRREGS